MKKKSSNSISFKQVKGSVVKAAPSTCNLWTPTMKVKTGIKAGSVCAG